MDPCMAAATLTLAQGAQEVASTSDGTSYGTRTQPSIRMRALRPINTLGTCH